jgi:hypothetical protein
MRFIEPVTPTSQVYSLSQLKPLSSKLPCEADLHTSASASYDAASQTPRMPIVDLQRRDDASWTAYYSGHVVAQQVDRSATATEIVWTKV